MYENDSHCNLLSLIGIIRVWKRERRPHRRDGGLLAGRYVRGAARNLDRFSVAEVHVAEDEAVGVRVLADGLDFAHHHAVEVLSDGLHGLHL
jgi:hypothetical protein